MLLLVFLLATITHLSALPYLHLTALDYKFFPKNETKSRKETKILLPTNVSLKHLTINNFEYLVANLSTESNELVNWTKIHNLKNLLSTTGMDEKHDVSLKSIFRGAGNVLMALKAFELNRRSSTKLLNNNVNGTTRRNPCELRIPMCSNPRAPTQISVATSILLDAYVINCHGPRSAYKWNLYDYKGHDLLYTFQPTSLPELKIKPYELRVHEKKLLLRLEADINNIHIKQNCYLQVAPCNTAAIISGGEKREVSYFKEIILDGKLSRSTFEKNEDNPTTLIFSWSCTSEDTSNSFCKKQFSNEMTVEIPAKMLRVSQKYKMRLKVFSKYDKSCSAVATQEITVVLEKRNQVYIQCKSNCFYKYYNPWEYVSLVGSSEYDKDDVIKYTWLINKSVIGRNKRVVRRLYTKSRYVDVVLVAVVEASHSSSQKMRLNKNMGPTKGHCTISPKYGIAFRTTFYITCKKFETIFKPISYIVTSKKCVLGYTMAEQTTVSLPTTNRVVVRVCDNMNVCTNEFLTVNVRPFEVPGGKLLQDFLNNKIQIKKLINDGYGNRALLLLNIVAREVKTAYQVQILLDVFNDYQPDNKITLGLLANMTRTLAESMSPLNNLKIKLLTNAVKLVNGNFEILKQDGTLPELGLMPYLNITQNCLTVLNIFSNISHATPSPPKKIVDMVKNSSRPLTDEAIKEIEKEILLLEGHEVIERAQLWLATIHQLDRLQYYIGITAVSNIKEDEDSIVFITEAFSFEIQCFFVDDYKFWDGHVMETFDGLNVVIFSRELLLELSDEHLGDRHICIKVLSLKRNLYWWYPEERQPSKRILSVTAFKKTTSPDDATEFQIENPLEYYTTIGNYDSIIDVRNKNKNPNTEVTIQSFPWQEIGRNAVKSYLGNEFDNDLVWHVPEDVNLLNFAPEKIINANFLRSRKKLDIINVDDDTQIDTVDNNEEVSSSDDRIFNKNKFKRASNITHNDTEPRSKNKNPSENNSPDESVTVKPSEIASSTGLYHNCLVQAKLNVYEQSLMYRVNLGAHSMLAVRFNNVTHDLRVLLKAISVPHRLDIAKSNCIVHANKSKIIIIRNNCKHTGTVYMGARVYTDKPSESCSDSLSENLDDPIENGPALFNFIFQIRACDRWVVNTRDPHWEQEGCYPSLDLDANRSLHCICEHLSTYTSYLYNVIAIPVPVYACSYTTLPINIKVTFFHGILWLSLFILIILTSKHSTRDKSVTECRILNEEYKDKDKENLNFLQMYVKTGSYACSGSTANITFRLETIDREEVCFTLFQDPANPSITTNSEYFLILNTPDILLPTKLALTHDGGGRYPSWFCDYILIKDLHRQHCQLFSIQTWIKSDQFVIIDGKHFQCLHGKELASRTTWQRFRDYVELRFINWFMFQPLFGEYRLNDTGKYWTRFERICVWTTKFFITITVGMIYFGRTTVDNYENLRDFYSATVINYRAIVFISIYSYTLCILVQLFFEKFLKNYT